MLIGKRSAASALRLVLAFLSIGLIIGAVVLSMIVIGLIASPEFAGVLDGWNAEAGGEAAGFVRAQVGFYLGALLSILATLWIFDRLRRILKAVNQGDAFEHANVGRLRAIGLGLIGLVCSRWLTALFAPRAADQGPDISFDAGTWVAILVVFILAEVFRQGARMRDDAQMTV